MAQFIMNEEKFFQENVTKYEDKLKSPLNRFIDKTPTFVTYYHIDNENTTVDQGLQNSYGVIHANSSIRFKKINKLPIYGLDAIIPQLSDEEQGLDTNYDGEAVITPSTITPFPNDFFEIPYLKGRKTLFRIKSVDYDSMRPEGYQKIEFRLETMDDEKYEQLQKQCSDKDWTCIYKNIGSDSRAVILSDDYERIQKIDKMYWDMADTYVSIYYNQKHNCFLGPDEVSGKFLYDPFMSVFIDKHGLFNRPDGYSAIVLSEQFTDTRRSFKYEKSIYRFIERNDERKISKFNYQLLPGTNYQQSSFYRWMDKEVLVLDIPDLLCVNTENFLFCQSYIEKVLLNGETFNAYDTFIKKYIQNKINSIDDIPLDLADEMLFLNVSKESFFFTPIVLYIIQSKMKEFMSQDGSPSLIN